MSRNSILNTASMRLNNVYLVGAAKAGTTSLYQVLSRHPKVCTPIVKEPNFYSNLDWNGDVVKPGSGPGDKGTVWTLSPDKYNSLYRVQAHHQVKLDGSVSYLYSSKAAMHIAAEHPDARIIIILRNPVDRAWSHYKHLIRDGRETGSFEEALEKEEARIGKGWEFSWHLRQMGCYSEQVERYLDNFGRERVRIYLFEDLVDNFQEVVRSSLDFIGLEPFEEDPEPERDNQSGVARNVQLARMVNWIVGYKVIINRVLGPSLTHSLMQKYRSINVREGKMKMNGETRNRLKEYFKDDVARTGHLIGRDLASWTR